MPQAMNLGRVFHTVRHLAPRRWADRLLCRGKFEAMAKWPHISRARFERAMLQVPRPDPASPRLASAARHVTQLQRAVHARFLDGIAQGRFTLLNREVDFGSLDGVEWRRELGEKNNRLWRMNLAYMGYLVPLFEDDPNFALPIAQSLLASMHAQNPWRSRGVFRDVWHPYAASHRVINLLACLQLADRAGMRIEGTAWETVLDEIRFGAAFVLRNLERDLQYNHLLKNLVCLATVSGAGEEGNCFAARQLQLVGNSVRQQFLGDGGQAERSPMYHLLSLMDLRILRDSGALEPATEALVSQAAEVSAAAANVMIHPDGDIALFNDSWAGEAPKAVSMVPGLDPQPEQSLQIELPNSGYIRLAQGRYNVVMDFGACGPDDNPGHAHADFLSVELSVNGVRTIVDTGVPTYSAGELRDRSRSAQRHNGPSLEGVEPIDFWSSFRVGRRGYAFKLPLPSGKPLSFAAWHSGYLRLGAIVARAIRLFPGRGLLIADVWAGARDHRAASHFLLSDAWRRTGVLRFCCAQASGTSSLEIASLEGAICATERAHYWHGFGMRREGTRVTLRPSEADGLQIAGLWICWDAQNRERQSCVSEAWPQMRSALLEAIESLPAFKTTLQKQQEN